MGSKPLVLLLQLPNEGKKFVQTLCHRQGLNFRKKGEVGKYPQVFAEP